MTPPIGSARAGVVSQVGSAIPDSAILRYRMGERSNSTITDALGSEDGTANGTTNTQNTGKWLDDHAEDGDGTDDYIESTKWADFGSQRDSGVAVEFTIQTTTTNSGYLMGSNSGSSTSGSNHFWVLLNEDGDFNSEEGVIGVFIRNDDDTGDFAFSIDPNDYSSINDGNPHRVVIDVNDPANNDADIYVDGTSRTVQLDRSDSPSSFQDFTANIPLLARENGGTIEEYANCILDDFLPHSATVGSSYAQDSYDRQPWS